MVNGYFPDTKKISKKQTKYLHLIKKIFISLPYITIKYKTMERTTDTPPGKADAPRKPHRRRSVKEISGTRKTSINFKNRKT